MQLCSSLGPSACIAIVLGTTSLGWLSMRLTGFSLVNGKSGGSCADIVHIAKTLKFKPLYVYDAGILVAKPPANFIEGNLEGVSKSDIDRYLDEQARLELQYKAVAAFEVDFEKITNVSLVESEGRRVLSLTLPQPALGGVRWTNEGADDKWDRHSGENGKWIEYLENNNNRKLFVSAAVRRTYDTEEYRKRARESTANIIKTVFGSFVTDPSTDINITWQSD